MDKSLAQRLYEKSVYSRHEAFRALSKAREAEAQAKVRYDAACLQTKILWLEYKRTRHG